MGGTSTPRRPSRWGLGLRARITLAFGLLALCLSVVLSGLVYTVATRSLHRQFVASATAETDYAQRLLLQGLSSRVPATFEELVRAANADPTVVTMAENSGLFAKTNSLIDPSELPAGLTERISLGERPTGEVDVLGRTYLLVGRPLPRGWFVQLYSVKESERAVANLRAALVGSAVLTALLGAGIGRFAGRRVLRPLSEFNRVAGAVASGNLTARLDAGGDADLVDVARTFNATVDDLERRVVADARFAVDVSHELRTPLTTMLNSVQVIQNRKAALPDAVREPLDLLAEELVRFRELVVDLLEISRNEAGDPPFLERAAVGDLVRLAADGEARRPVTTVHPSAVGVLMRVDKRRLERVVANLVCNADHHGRGCTGVDVDVVDDTLRIVVEDAGPGVPVGSRERIFERFARGSTERSGVGLGLAIVRRHVALHGGAVRVTAAEGGGARFVVQLPLGGPEGPGPRPGSP